MWPHLARSSPTAARWALRALPAAVFLALSLVLKIGGFWDKYLLFNSKCAHPENQDGSTGLKVIVAAFAKSGTRTIAHSLNRIGLRTYHSEDVDSAPYREYADIARTKDRYRHLAQGEIGAPVWYDPWARDQLMRAISRCGVEGVALDGLERMFWPLYHASPDAKVILLDWRRYEDWSTSLNNFAPKLMVMVVYNIVQDSLASLLPWAFAIKVADQLAGGKFVMKPFAEGGPPGTEVSGPVVFYYMSHFIYQFHGATFFPIAPFGVIDFAWSSHQYKSWLQAVRDGVPKDRLLSWSPKNSTYEELCDFLGISPCPASGRTQKARNTWLWERDFPVSAYVTGVVRFFEIWCNWKVLCGAISLLHRLLSSRCRKVKTG